MVKIEGGISFDRLTLKFELADRDGLLETCQLQRIAIGIDLRHERLGRVVRIRLLDRSLPAPFPYRTHRVRLP